jgi:hypothetical protein
MLVANGNRTRCARVTLFGHAPRDTPYGRARAIRQVGRELRGDGCIGHFTDGFSHPGSGRQ